MGIRETSLIYSLVGVVIAAALVLRSEETSRPRRALLGAAGLVFWPLFAPVLLAGKRRDSSPSHAFDERIRGAEAQLVAALSRIRGVAEDVVAPEVARVHGLAGAMAAMEQRVREMDTLLATAEFDAAAATSALVQLESRGLAEDDPRLESVRSRLRNIDRLRQMRNRTGDDLERIVLKLEEMSSQLRLLEFAGRSDAELVQVVKEIADSVQEVTEGLLQAG
jgi:DNA repair ATPase RecN